MTRRPGIIASASRNAYVSSGFSCEATRLSNCFSKTTWPLPPATPSCHVPARNACPLSKINAQVKITFKLIFINCTRLSFCCVCLCLHCCEKHHATTPKDHLQSVWGTRRKLQFWFRFTQADHYVTEVEIKHSSVDLCHGHQTLPTCQGTCSYFSFQLMDTGISYK